MDGDGVALHDERTIVVVGALNLVFLLDEAEAECVVDLGHQVGEAFGWALASGGDGQADGAVDLLMGAPQFDAAAGRVVQLFGPLPTGRVSIDEVGTSVPGTVWEGSTR